MKRITIPFLIVIFTLLFTISAFALIRPSATAEWKEDILTLLSLVKRVGDYSEVVDLIEIAPALKEDPEIKKAYVDFAPPGVTPPEWARGEAVPPAVIEVPKKIEVEKKEKVLPEVTEKEEEAQRIAPEVAAQKEEPAPLAIIEIPEKIAGAEAEKEKERREIKEKEAQKIAQEVAAQRKVREREAAPPEIIKEEPKIETPKEVAIIEGPPEKIAIAETPVWPPDRPKEKERREIEEGIEEELRVIPTPLPSGAKVVHSTDVVSRVEAIEEGGRLRVVITLSGERKYTVSERSRPPSIIINIPHTMNTIFPETIPINRGCVKAIKAIQYRCLPFDEARIIIVLDRWVEYKVESKDNEIHIDFEGAE